MRRLWIGLAALVGCLIGAAAAGAQTNPNAPGNPNALAGTLKKARDTGVVTIGYREASFPFSYLDARREPIGYSIDLCRLIVETMSDEIGRELQLKWVPVTSASRFEALTSGQIDLECGSTTQNVERQATASFSPVIFVAGTKLMVRRDAGIRSFRDLRGKTVVVTAGTTNEKALRDVSTRFNIGANIVATPDHDQSFAMFMEGKADAYAGDDILLYGQVARAQADDKVMVVGDFLSYDPYGIMFRRGDPAMAGLVDRMFRTIAESRELEHTYNRWFMHRLPGGERLRLPMSAQLESIFGTLSARPD
ncbi:Glutamate/aspartate periplasmic-binding protein precursor [bacterium YEK0313]|nr:Glutamate/aspartate periplasmic-binding protein precursor [bacterium YEK0313]